MLFFSCTSVAQTYQERRPVKLDGTIRVAADLVDGNNGCYTVNVRIYLTYNNQEILVANSNVNVGDCPQNRMATNLNSECKDELFKGDFFFYSKDHYKYCLVDLLLDDVTYAKYVIEKNKVIDSVKK